MERLTIDEIITRCERFTKSSERIISKEYFETEDMSNIHVKKYWEHKQVAEYLKELKQFKDKQEQGLLIELPCKVGDIVYQIHTLSKSNRKVLVEVMADEFFVALCTLEKRFGKTVFLTRSEAEEALAKMGE